MFEMAPGPCSACCCHTIEQYYKYLEATECLRAWCTICFADVQPEQPPLLAICMLHYIGQPLWPAFGLHKPTSGTALRELPRFGPLRALTLEDSCHSPRRLPATS